MSVKWRLNAGEIFDDAASSSLSKRSAKGGYHSALTQIGSFVVSTTATIVLARILTPEDFGLMAMVLVFLNFAAMFKDAGLSLATVQQDRVSEIEISSLFWVNVFISFLVAVILLILSPIISDFYSRSEINTIMPFLAISFLVSGISVQHKALIQRLLRFDLIGIVHVGSQVIGLASAIIYAILYQSYMALVINTLVMNVVSTILFFYILDWRPRLAFNYSKTKKMLSFGGNVTGFNLVNYFSRNGDNILIGRFLGSEELGLYSKAYQLFMMPVRQIRNPLNAVMIPVLSRINEDGSRYNLYCSVFTEILAVLSFPLTLVCYLEADFIINLLLGKGWENSVPVFKVLALGGFLQIISGVRGGIMLSQGKSKRYFLMGLFYACITTISFIFGINYGITGVAVAFVIVQYIFFLPSLYYSFHGTPFTVRLFFIAIKRQFYIGISLCIIHSILTYYYEWNSLCSILTIILIPLGYFGFNYISTGFRKRFLSIVKSIRS